MNDRADIVKRLRRLATTYRHKRKQWHEGDWGGHSTASRIINYCEEAAAEIERLRISAAAMEICERNEGARCDEACPACLEVAGRVLRAAANA